MGLNELYRPEPAPLILPQSAILKENGTDDNDSWKQLLN